VDEFQDLNECDQEFILRIWQAGANVFIAGDDDQSVYAFRHAAPTGIQNFGTTFKNSSSHQLEYCFRCTPDILSGAVSLVSANPNRIPKIFMSLYANAAPVVQGSLKVWRFKNGVDEARAITQSAEALLSSGVSANEMLVLVNNSLAQLPLLTEEFSQLGLPFERPGGGWILDSDMPMLVFGILRIIRNSQDYIAHRTIIGLQSGVGPGTCTGIASKVVSANLNFRDIFYIPYPPGIFSDRENRAISNASLIVQQISTWQLSDILESRKSEIDGIIATVFNAAGSKSGQELVAEFQLLVNSLPVGMNFEEFLSYLASDTEAGQVQVLDSVDARLGTVRSGNPVFPR
jgi:superfamily I DNA/RNA helicase